MPVTARRTLTRSKTRIAPHQAACPRVFTYEPPAKQVMRHSWQDGRTCSRKCALRLVLAAVSSSTLQRESRRSVIANPVLPPKKVCPQTCQFSKSQRSIIDVTLFP